MIRRTLQHSFIARTQNLKLRRVRVAILIGCVSVANVLSTPGFAHANPNKNSEVSEDVFKRKVSLTAVNMPLREALSKVASEAGVVFAPDEPALRDAGLDLDKRISVTLKAVPLGGALGQLIIWEQHVGVFRELQGDRLVLTTLVARRERTKNALPDWMKPFDKGISATINRDGDVVSVSISRGSDDLMGKLRTLPKLQSLQLSSPAGITTAGLDHLVGMKQLQKMKATYLHENGDGFCDALLKRLAGHESLRELDFNECGMTDAGARYFERLPQLTRLSIYQESRLTDAALLSIGKLKNLKHLHLITRVSHPEYGFMEFGKDGLKHLRHLQNLESLVLTRWCAPAVPAEMLSFLRLRSLSFDGCKLEADCADRISAMKELKSLSLNSTGITDAGLRKIASLPALESLSMTTSVVTDKGMAHLGLHSKLRSLNLNARHMTDAWLDHVGSMTALASLSVSGEHISDVGVAHLKTLPALTFLQLDVSGLTDASLEHIAQLKSLNGLSLQNNRQSTLRITTNGLKQLNSLADLRSLSIDNFSTKNVGAGLSGLKQLRSLSLMIDKRLMTEPELDALSAALPNTYIRQHWWSGSDPVPWRERPRRPGR